jgi:hypothetical protein
MSDESLLENAEQYIETGTMMLYKGFSKYREAGNYRAEYEAMSTLSIMLHEDCKYLLNHHKDKINAIVQLS